MVGSLLILILLGGAIAAGVAVATILLGNRHTRGSMQFVAIGLVVLVAAVVMWNLTSARSGVEESTQSIAAHLEHERTLIENQASYFDQLADNYEHQSGVQSEQLARQFREQAEFTRSQMPDYSYTVSNTQHQGRAFALFSPAILIVFLVIVFLLFKHAGPGVGLAALALPVVVLFFSYTRLERTTHHAYNQPSPVVEGDHFLETMEAPASEIQVSLDTQSTEVAAPQPTLQVQPAVAEVEDSAEFVSVADVSTDMVAADSAKVVEDEPVVEEPIAATPIQEVPDWVRQPPKSAPHVHRRVLESGWYGTADECLHQIESGPIDAAIVEHLHELAVEDSMNSNLFIPSPRSLGITKRYLRENVIKDEFYQTGDFTHESGMKNLYVLLEFDSRTSDDLLARWRDYTRRGVVAGVAAGMGGILVCLAGLLGLVKLDTYTKGYYTKRLFIGVPAAIIGIGVLISIFK